MNANPNPALNSILDEVIAYSSHPALEENEFTVQDYIARFQETRDIAISECTARRRLNEQVKDGHLTKRLVRRGTAQLNAYRLVPKKEVDITPPSG